MHDVYHLLKTKPLKYKKQAECVEIPIKVRMSMTDRYIGIVASKTYINSTQTCLKHVLCVKHVLVIFLAMTSYKRNITSEMTAQWFARAHAIKCSNFLFLYNNRRQCYDTQDALRCNEHLGRKMLVCK